MFDNSEGRAGSESHIRGCNTPRNKTAGVDLQSIKTPSPRPKKYEEGTSEEKQKLSPDQNQNEQAEKPEAVFSQQRKAIDNGEISDDKLQNIKRTVFCSLIASAIVLLILAGSVTYFLKTRKGTFPQSPKIRYENYGLTNEKIVQHFFIMQEPSLLSEGNTVKGSVEAVYNQYSGAQSLSPTIGRITLLHMDSGITLQAFNPKNIDLQYELQKIIRYYMKQNVTEVKRLLTAAGDANEPVNQNAKNNQLPQILNKGITQLYSTLINVDVSLLENIQEAALIGITKNNLNSSDGQAEQYEIQEKQANPQQSQLELLNAKAMTQEERTILVNSIIEKVVRPILSDLTRQIVQYGPTIAQKVGLIFDESVDLRVTYQKEVLVQSKNQNGDPDNQSRPSLYITRQTQQIYAFKPENPADTKTMTERIYNAITSCTSFNQTTKMCSEEEWFSSDTPFQRTKKSQENSKDYKVFKRNQVSAHKKNRPRRKLEEAAVTVSSDSTCSSSNAASNQNSGSSSVTPNQSSGSSTVTSSQAMIN